jgi:hypothetical protein
MSGPIRIETDGGVRLLTLDRGDEYNTINPALRDALSDALDDADRDRDVEWSCCARKGRRSVRDISSTGPPLRKPSNPAMSARGIPWSTCK